MRVEKSASRELFLLAHQRAHLNFVEVDVRIRRCVGSAFHRQEVKRFPLPSTIIFYLSLIQPVLQHWALALLRVEYRMDENQVLEFSLHLAKEADGRAFDVRIENPLSNVVNPHEDC